MIKEASRQFWPLLVLAICLLILLLSFGLKRAPREIEASTAFECLIWNVESGGNDPVWVASCFSDFTQVDVWGLQEVAPNNAELYFAAINDLSASEFRMVLGQNGRNDRLLIVCRRYYEHGASRCRSK